MKHCNKHLSYDYKCENCNEAAKQPKPSLAEPTGSTRVPKKLDLKDRPGVITVAELRQHFERMVAHTPHFQNRTPLGIMEINGQFSHYMDQNTDTMWLGFALGMRCAERLSNDQAQARREQPMTMKEPRYSEPPPNPPLRAARGSATATIYASQDAANAALPKCPRAKGGKYYHWWYIDIYRLGRSSRYVPCVCGTCGQKMNLSPDAEDYPAERPS